MRSEAIWDTRLHKYAEDGMSRKSIPDLSFFLACTLQRLLACLHAIFRHGLTFISFFLPALNWWWLDKRRQKTCDGDITKVDVIESMHVMLSVSCCSEFFFSSQFFPVFFLDVFSCMRVSIEWKSYHVFLFFLSDLIYSVGLRGFEAFLQG